jgi:hypothetical protein
MRKLITMAGAALVLAASSLAAVADGTSGSITAVDATANTITLDNGQTYVLPTGLDPLALKVGQSVSVRFIEEDGGKLKATQVVPEQATPVVPQQG